MPNKFKKGDIVLCVSKTIVPETYDEFLRSSPLGLGVIHTQYKRVGHELGEYGVSSFLNQITWEFWDFHEDDLILIEKKDAKQV